MKHEPITTTIPTLKGINLKSLFSTISSRELAENILLFFLCRICFMDYLISPFGISFFSVLFFHKKRASYILFSALGVLSLTNGVFAFKYVGCMLIILTTQLIFAQELVHKKRMMALITAGAQLLSGGVYVAVEGFFSYDTLLLILETALTLVSFFIFDRALFSIKALMFRKTTDACEILPLGFLLGCVVFSVALTRNFWPLAHIASIFIILFAGLFSGVSVSTPLGAIFGTAIGLATVYPAQTVCIYTLSSLLSGLASRYSRLGVSGAFALSSLITTLFLCPETNGLLTVSYVAAACLLLFFIPDEVFYRLDAAAIVPRKENRNLEKVRTTATMRITEAISSIDSVGTIFHEVIESMRDAKCDTRTAVFEATAEAVCKNCSLCRFCWQKDREKTLLATDHMYTVLETKNTLAKKDVPKDFTEMCIRTDSFVCELNKNYESLKVARMWAGKVKESKRLIAEQFKNISMILKNVRSTITEQTDFIPDAERRIASELSRRGISCDEISVCKKDGFSVEITRLNCENHTECEGVMLPVLSDVLEVPMEKEPTDCEGSVCHVRFLQKTKLKTDIAISCKTKNNSSGSGDNASFFPLGDGKIALILADGMGSGSHANFQSSIAVKLAKKLMSAGFNKETCVRLINDILLTNADRDTFSTIDLCIINLYTGNTEFIKTGACNTYMKLQSTFDTIRASSLPAGIMQSVEPDFDKRTVCCDDFFVMATDGVTDVLDTDRGNEIFSLCEGFSGTAQELSDAILQRALECSGGVATDDMTVVVCRVLKNL